MEGVERVGKGSFVGGWEVKEVEVVETWEGSCVRCGRGLKVKVLGRDGG